jgi:hypothetical protein
LAYDNRADRLQHVSIVNIYGIIAAEYDVPEAGQGYFSMDLSGLNKGIYLVKCNFANGTETRQIILQ